MSDKSPDFAEFYRKSKDQCLLTVGNRDKAQDLRLEIDLVQASEACTGS